ncbi:MAG: NmrA family NAD(P)-binding protein [Cyanobacteria bacterium P01_H01_bin.15]
MEQQGFSFVHLRPEAFMQNITGPGYRWLEGQTIRHYLGDARWSWIDSNDLALVAAHALREPHKFSGQTIPLGYDAKSFAEVAEILSRATGQTIVAEALPPEEFLQSALASGADPAYMNSVYTQFKLNGEGAIPQADAIFDNFEHITGRQPTTWPVFAERFQQAQRQITP